MLKRLLLGLVIGLVVGAAFAALLVGALHISFASTPLAFVFAAIAGMVTGMVAGKPIWAKGGAIEAGLKAFFGAALAVGAMFALRQWGQAFQLNMSFVHDGDTAQPVSNLASVSLPLITTVLGIFFGLDNTPAPEEEKDRKAPSKKAALPPKSVSRVAAAEAVGEEEEAEAPPKKSRH